MDGEEDHDPLDSIDVEDESDNPMVQLERSQTMIIIEKALEKLPARQREAFVLRYWEEMDVAETAAMMGCSQGSVKTHCSRAVHSMAATLQKQGLGKKEISAIAQLGAET